MNNEAKLLDNCLKELDTLTQEEAGEVCGSMIVFMTHENVLNTKRLLILLKTLNNIKSFDRIIEVLEEKDKKTIY